MIQLEYELKRKKWGRNLNSVEIGGLEMIKTKILTYLYTRPLRKKIIDIFCQIPLYHLGALSGYTASVEVFDPSVGRY